VIILDTDQLQPMYDPAKGPSKIRTIRAYKIVCRGTIPSTTGSTLSILQQETRYRPGGGETICPPPMAVRRWQKSRRIYVRPRTGPQSAHLWWPAVAKLQAASVPIPRQLRHGTDRRTDRAIPVVSMNTIGGSGQRFMVESTLVIIVAAIRPT